MSPAEKNANAGISQARKSMDQARNEKQKSVLLKAVAELGQRRSSRAQANSRVLCGRAEMLASRNAHKKH